ncbi:MAG TPA: cupin domain-containing protein [Azospira sp.]|nr:cupin domain-containing protein [Azospira sp.]
MARLFTPDGKQEADPAAVSALAQGLGLTLRHLPLPDDPDTAALLARPELSQEEQARLLQRLDASLGQAVQAPAGAGRDLVAFHADLPELPRLRQQFTQVHTHADHEVRYILAGTGYFGVVRGDSSQVLLEAGPGDYLEVPAGAEHWFALGADPRLKALRVFSREKHWVADYTGRRADPALLALLQA